MASSRRWGPEHQHHPGPRDPGGVTALVVLATLALFVVWCWGLLHPGSHPFDALARDAVVIAGAVVATRAAAACAARRAAKRAPVSTRVAPGGDPLAAVRRHAVAAGGGAYLGARRGSFVFADPEHGVLLLGPPRSGKTSGVVIPALLACPGACVSTSTKPDVLHSWSGVRSVSTSRVFGVARTDRPGPLRSQPTRGGSRSGTSPALLGHRGAPPAAPPCWSRSPAKFPGESARRPRKRQGHSDELFDVEERR